MDASSVVAADFAGEEGLPGTGDPAPRHGVRR
jgi:hypothetical protein